MSGAAGIPSFRAVCPPSPRRDDAPSGRYRAFVDDEHTMDCMDMDGIQGVSAFSKTSGLRRLIVSPRILSSGHSVLASNQTRSEPNLRAAPSTAQTVSSHSDHSMKLRSCQLVLPADGPDNDAVRTRNAGKKLSVPLLPCLPKLLTGQVSDALRHTISEGFFPAVHSTTGNRTLRGLEPMDAGSPRGQPQAHAVEGRTTPRTMKGIVRKATTVHLEYPGLLPSLRDTASLGESLTKEMHRRYTFRKKNFGASSPTKVRTVGRNEHDLMEAARGLSNRKMGVLYSLRRVGKETSSEPTSPGSPSSPSRKRKTPQTKKTEPVQEPSVDATVQDPAIPTDGKMSAEANVVTSELSLEEQAELSIMARKELEQEDKETTLLNSTLRSETDTCQVLSDAARTLSELKDPAIVETGGMRHPTAVLAGRTLAVMNRKASLLKAVEERLFDLEDKCKSKEAIFKNLVEGSAPCPEGLLGVRQFVAEYAHKPEENPSDANKSNFALFASTFGLPKKHMHFERMMSLANMTALWWSAETLAIAQNGADSDVIKRQMDVVNGIGADKAALDKAEEAMRQCAALLGDRLAEKCLIVAEQLQEKDRQCVERSKDAQPQSAKDCAAGINDQISRAASLGAPTKHDAMKRAKIIATELEKEEFIRYGLKVFLFCQQVERQDRDYASNYEKAEGMPPVGPASEAADRLDREIKAAIKKGAPESHEHIRNAVSIAKGLRDLDGIRKREANRVKRQKQG